MTGIKGELLERYKFIALSIIRIIGVINLSMIQKIKQRNDLAYAGNNTKD